ncbi:TonB-dependent receptor [Aureibacter tunicatorum]|uniref:Outer membrane receptor for ferrienterochelin and colicins n=1 Tax=Aureibacter tunicatorum TaxID=866807 RepID=A0AAE4BRD7_9BACT|nr:TonB-dependent receptor [Aureibacter tunicatorum]MDR6237670.1 outer membrane receptor for ferrienterochelin and colicins [Aureibacter tunicatorum]
MKKILLFFCFILAMTNAMSQSISGRVVSNNEAVPFASLQIKNTNLGVASDEDGRFSFEKLQSGQYTVQCQAVGFKSKSIDINLTNDENAELTIELNADLLNLEEVVVSGTRTSVVRKESPVIVTVTDEKIFNAVQAVSLSEGLSFQPGLRMETNCSNCGFSQVRINGLEGAYSQILIDSRPVFSALNSIYGLEQIPSNMVDRIEVIRGGGSALYGSNAIAGTINVITKDPVDNTFQIGMNSALVNGSSMDNMLNANGSIVSDDGMSGMSLFGMTRERQEYDHNDDGFSEIPMINNLTFGMKGFHRFSELEKMTIEFHTTREHRRGGDSLNLPAHESNIAEELRSTIYGGGASYERFSRDRKNYYSVYASVQNTDMKNYYGAGKDPDGYGRTFDNTFVTGGQFTRTMDKFAGGEGTFTGGVEYKSDVMSDSKPGYGISIEQDLRMLGVYAQQEWKPVDRLKLLFGLRYDYNNLTEENILNPRFNFMYDLTPDLQFRASYARGYRAPQVFTDDVHAELISGEVRVIRLGPDLESELSNSYLASFDWNKSSGLSQYGLTLEGFFTRLNNPFILEGVEDDNFPDQQILEKRNGDGASVYGLNIEAKYAYTQKLQLQGGFTVQRSLYDNEVVWTSSEDSEVIKNTSSKRFLRTPDVYANMVISYYPVEKFGISNSAVFTGSMLVPLAERDDEFIQRADQFVNTKEFFEWNIKFDYDLDISDQYCIQFNAGVQNILNSYQSDIDPGENRDASYVYGPGRPRTFFVGVKIGNAF